MSRNKTDKTPEIKSMLTLHCGDGHLFIWKYQENDSKSVIKLLDLIINSNELTIPEKVTLFKRMLTDDILNKAIKKRYGWTK